MRDQRIAYILGTSIVGDSFVLAYRIPNLMRRLVGEGAVSAAFVPVFTSYLARDDREDALDFANKMFWTLAAVLAVVTALGVIFAPLIVKLLTFGRGRVDVPLAISLNRIVWPFVLFIGLSALALATLNSFRIFALPALTPAVLSLSVIASSFVAFRFHQPAFALALGVLAGGVLQLAIQLPLLWKRGIRLRFGISFRHPGVWRASKLMIPGVAGVGIAQVNFLVNTAFATHPLMPAGSLMSLQIADRVMELVLGAYAVAIATAILPTMSAQVAERNIDQLRRTISFSLKLVSFITIPAMVGLVVLRGPIIQVLFQHGRFDAQSTRLTAWALLFSALGLPWFAAAKVVLPAFYSAEDTRTPVMVGAVAVVANVVFNLAFVGPLRNGGPAAATSLAAVVYFVVLYWVFRKRYGEIGAPGILASVGKTAVAAGVMGLACWWLLQYSGFWGSSSGLQHSAASQAAVLLGTLVAAVACFFAMARLLGCDELRDVYALATHQARRVGAGGSGILT